MLAYNFVLLFLEFFYVISSNLFYKSVIYGA